MGKTTFRATVFLEKEGKEMTDFENEQFENENSEEIGDNELENEDLDGEELTEELDQELVEKLENGTSFKSEIL